MAAFLYFGGCSAGKGFGLLALLYHKGLIPERVRDDSVAKMERLGAQD
ncbi:MAG: hypothetical protein KDD04_10635 [Sinomicrobium sp.]|nr:hypothetical protein [Sinomicrobium sp.]